MQGLPFDHGKRYAVSAALKGQGLQLFLMLHLNMDSVQF